MGFTLRGKVNPSDSLHRREARVPRCSPPIGARTTCSPVLLLCPSLLNPPSFPRRRRTYVPVLTTWVITAAFTIVYGILHYYILQAWFGSGGRDLRPSRGHEVDRQGDVRPAALRSPLWGVSYTKIDGGPPARIFCGYAWPEVRERCYPGFLRSSSFFSPFTAFG